MKKLSSELYNHLLNGLYNYITLPYKLGIERKEADEVIYSSLLKSIREAENTDIIKLEDDEFSFLVNGIETVSEITTFHDEDLKKEYEEILDIVKQDNSYTIPLDFKLTFGPVEKD